MELTDSEARNESRTQASPVGHPPRREQLRASGDPSDSAAGNTHASLVGHQPRKELLQDLGAPWNSVPRAAAIRARSIELCWLQSSCLGQPSAAPGAADKACAIQRTLPAAELLPPLSANSRARSSYTTRAIHRTLPAAQPSVGHQPHKEQLQDLGEP